MFESKKTGHRSWKKESSISATYYKYRKWSIPGILRTSMQKAIGAKIREENYEYSISDCLKIKTCENEAVKTWKNIPSISNSTTVENMIPPFSFKSR